MWVRQDDDEYETAKSRSVRVADLSLWLVPILGGLASGLLAAIKGYYGFLEGWGPRSPLTFEEFVVVSIAVAIVLFVYELYPRIRYGRKLQFFCPSCNSRKSMRTKQDHLCECGAPFEEADRWIWVDDDRSGT
jgi:hypothetical protein